MTDPKRKIIEGNNPKDLRSDSAYIIRVLNTILYSDSRWETTDIPKELLESELIFFFVEDKCQKTIGEFLVQRTKARVYIPQIPKKKKNSGNYTAGRDVVSWILDRKILEKFSSEPLVKKIINNRVIGLIDLDFEQLSPDTLHQGCLNLYQCSRYKNLFATETNDIETFFLCYGGFPIFLQRFSKTSTTEEGNHALTRTILYQAELLGDAFKATKKTGVKFSHMDYLTLKEYHKILDSKNPEEWIINCILKENTDKDPSNINNFITLFYKLREEREIQNSKSCPPNIGKDDLISVDALSGCRGHSLMPILCCHSSFDVKMDFIQNTKDDTDMLFNKIFKGFKKNNSVCQSKLYLSLRAWEQKSHVDFLKKCLNGKIFD